MEFITSKEFIVLMLFPYAALMLFFAHKLVKAEKRFLRECIHTTGIVVEYKRDFDLQHPGERMPLEPVVSLVVNNETITDFAEARKMNETTCPVGSRVKILYDRHKVGILGYFQTIRVDEEDFRPTFRPNTRIDVVFLRVFAVVILLAAVFAVYVYFG
ncbi:hypothetical protein AGMMS49975_02190 [Clostridia bacterium]|nr:hypothetical protein AGMMS49975_02190 [Clostridia bacterium]